MNTVVKRSYRQPKSECVRMIVEIPKPEVEAIDAWGIPIGMPSRTATVRELLRKGLKAIANEAAAGEACKHNPAA